MGKNRPGEKMEKKTSALTYFAILIVLILILIAVAYAMRWI